MKIEIKISDERIMDLLCSAFEGGTGYWCKIKKNIQQKGAVPPIKKWGSSDPTPFTHCWLPLVESCGLLITEDCGDEGCEVVDHLLDRHMVERGLKAMAEKCGRHFGDFMAENG